MNEILAKEEEKEEKTKCLRRNEKRKSIFPEQGRKKKRQTIELV